MGTFQFLHFFCYGLFVVVSNDERGVETSVGVVHVTGSLGDDGVLDFIAQARDLVDLGVVYF